MEDLMEYVLGMGKGGKEVNLTIVYSRLSTVSVSGIKILTLMTHDSYHHLPFSDEHVNFTYL